MKNIASWNNLTLKSPWTLPVMCATVQNTLGCTLDKHFGSGSNTAGFLGGAESGHGFTISGEFQSEFLLPFGFHILPEKRKKHSLFLREKNQCFILPTTSQEPKPILNSKTTTVSSIFLVHSHFFFKKLQIDFFQVR